MNDPLKDKRIFPEEMQQKNQTSTKKPINLLPLLVTFVVVAVLVFLGLYAYRGYQANQQQAVEEDLDTERREREEQVYENIVSTQSPLTAEEREAKINAIFNSNS